MRAALGFEIHELVKKRVLHGDLPGLANHDIPFESMAHDIDDVSDLLRLPVSQGRDADVTFHFFVARIREERIRAAERGPGKAPRGQPCSIAASHALSL